MDLYRILVVLLGLLITQHANAQTLVSGTVKDKKGNGIPGVNVYIKNTYDGSATDSVGAFYFEATEPGQDTVVATSIGYDNAMLVKKISGKSVVFDLILKPKVNQLDAVTISAGAFEASDEKKMVLLRPLDIVSTAGASGDIDGAIKTLPGAQLGGEQEGLFVRGGDASETKTIVDGMIVSNPYFGSVPSVPSRGRFSPFLFKGTSFSTGGYSAQYGQAMSSALILESQDMPSSTITSVGITALGGALGHLYVNKNQTQSIGVNVNYFNLSPYFKLIKQNRNWIQAPENVGASLFYRLKPTKTGMIKGYIDYGQARLGVEFDDINDTTGIVKKEFRLNNKNIYSNVSYRDILSKKTSVFVGASYTLGFNDIKANNNASKYRNDYAQGRAMITYMLSELSSVRVGGDVSYSVASQLPVNANNQLKIWYPTMFVEGDLYINPKLVARVGLRSEWSSYLQRFNIAQRYSMAYKTGKESQLSVAYGDFYQSPNALFLSPAVPALQFEKATHYIVNWQKIAKQRTLRFELFYKSYAQLVRFNKTIIDNSGKGYAQGFDVFYRDKKMIKYGDFWVSYSYVDSRRLYLMFPSLATPTFVSNHTLSLVYKQFFPKRNFGVGGTYQFNSGRPYYNPNNPIFLSDRTPFFHNFSANLTYLTRIKDNFTVIVLSCDNVFGIDNVFQYQYSNDGRRREAINQAAPRSIFVGMFITIGSSKNTGADTD